MGINIGAVLKLHQQFTSLRLQQISSKIKLMLTRQHKGWIAFEFRDDMVFAAAIKLNKHGQAEVLKVGQAAVALDDSGSLANFAKAFPYPDFSRVCLLPRGAYDKFVLSKPQVKHEEVGNSLKWEIATSIDYPIQDAIVNWSELPIDEVGPDKINKCLVIVSKNSQINQWVNYFSRSGLILHAVDVPESSHRNIAHLFHHAEPEGVFLVVPESRGVQLSLTWKGRLILDRFLPTWVSFDDQTNRAERVAFQVHRTIVSIARNYPSIVLSKVYVAGWEGGHAVQEHLANIMGDLSVEMLNLGDLFVEGLNSQVNSDEVFGQYFNVLGAAMRFI